MTLDLVRSVFCSDCGETRVVDDDTASDPHGLDCPNGCAGEQVASRPRPRNQPNVSLLFVHPPCKPLADRPKPSSAP